MVIFCGGFSSLKQLVTQNKDGPHFHAPQVFYKNLTVLKNPWNLTFLLVPGVKAAAIITIIII